MFVVLGFGFFGVSVKTVMKYKTEVGVRVYVRGSFERKHTVEMIEEKVEKPRALPAREYRNVPPLPLNPADGAPATTRSLVLSTNTQSACTVLQGLFSRQEIQQ